MKIICKSVTSRGFDLKEVTTVFSHQVDYGPNGRGLKMHGEYIVMGTVTYKDSNCLYYLIDINGYPLWFPYVLFDVSDNSLPDNWFVKIIPKTDLSFVYILCGFDELCNEEDFYGRLGERELQAMQTYFRHKVEMEQKLAVGNLDS